MIQEVYYKTIKIGNAFSSNYIEYKSKDKTKLIQPIITINFISSKDSGETRIMHSKSDNIEIMIGSETDEIIEELIESLSQR